MSVAEAARGLPFRGERYDVDRALAPDVRWRLQSRRLVPVVLPLVCVIALLIWLPGWIQPSVSRARIRTAVVTTGSIEAVITASGTVVPEVERVLSSPLDAHVLRILERPGATLKQGDPVVALDVSESTLALETLETDLEIKENTQAQTALDLEKSLAELDGSIEVKQLELELARAKHAGNLQLSKEALVSEEALRQSELALNQARIELAQLREERRQTQRSTDLQMGGLALERTSLRREAAEARRVLELATTKSDRNGVLTWVLAEEGVLVPRGEVIARIADLSSFRVDATVSDVHASRIQRGMAVIVSLDDRVRLEGTVSEVYPTVENGSLRFTVTLEERSHSRLRPSLRVDVLVITDRKPRVLKVKRGPFADGTGERQAFVIRGNRAVRADITLGASSFDELEVTSGLNEGDEVIISDMRDYLHAAELKVRN
ncbi:MAG: HlyD family efflux transporter periplasmic adaptor subunit [Luteitalea sp.]|nr:HlyD family efflux transporter periplasmic adaptor subunit [Luteitalea sp.]